MLLNRIIKFFTSLRLTVVLLAFAIVLVWVGTVAQADEGLYQAQTRYFKQWIVIGATLFGHKVPLILPGGYLIGSVLLLNLVAAHISRFQFTTKKLGIHIAHAGIILLLVGQLTTDIFSRETQIHFVEGQTKSYAESPANYELIFSTAADANNNEEIVIPGRLLAQGGEIRNAQLPFTVRVKNFWKNSEPNNFRAPMMQNGPPLTTNGLALNFDIRPVAEVKSTDERNIPSALVEIVGPNGSLGDWVASAWAGDESVVEAMGENYAQQMGPQMAQNIVRRLTQPQSFVAGGKEYTFTLRPERIYTPFSLTLLKATHTVYPGSDIPKDFRSRVRLQNSRNGEDREVEIFMNNPLRYAGLTFYQYQMTAGEVARQAGRTPSSVLMVVRNPSWLTPYVGCILVAAGLLVQFLTHLTGFISKRRNIQPSTSNLQPRTAGSQRRASVPLDVGR